MTYDRTDYRAMGTGKLLVLAEEHGIDEELAIALAERLARPYAPYTDKTGKFRANFKGTKTHA